MANQPVALAVFDFLRDARGELTAASSVDEAFRSTSAAREFCLNFFLQFFENALEVPIESVSMKSAAEANVLAKKRRELTKPQRALIRRFQHLCKIDADIRGGDYGGGRVVYRSFHEDFLPTLLDDIAAWARSEEQDELAVRADAEAESYRSTVDQVEAGPDV